MKKLIAGLVAALSLTAIAPALASPAGADGGTSDVYVVHGLPLDDAGTIVDVYVNGDRAIDDFAFGKTVGPLSLPADTYDIDIVAGDAADNSAPLFSQSVAVPAGGNFSVVASFDGSGTHDAERVRQRRLADRVVGGQDRAAPRSRRA